MVAAAGELLDFIEDGFDDLRRGEILPAADRVAIQSESRVMPGEYATFTFQVRAPSRAGTYTLRLQPVVDGTMWLEDEGVFILISVVP